MLLQCLDFSNCLKQHVFKSDFKEQSFSLPGKKLEDLLDKESIFQQNFHS